MDLPTRIKFESKIVPGAVVYFKRATAAGRTVLLESLAKARTKIREIQRQRKPLDDAYGKALESAKRIAKAEVDRLIEAENITRAEAEQRVQLKIEMPDDDFAAWLDLMDQQRQIERDVQGIAGLRAQFLGIEGVTVDGHTPTIDELIESAPVEFVDELIAAADRIAGLSPTERGESLWPTTSPAVEDGPSQNTTAPTVASEPEAA